MNAQQKLMAKIWGGVILVFALGAVTGAALNGLLSARQAATSTTPISMYKTEVYFQTLRQEIDLSAEQERQMHAILDEMTDKYKGVCAEARPRYYALREDARLRMRQLLTADQQQRFDQIVTQDDCRCPEQ
jgi:hypothetical protein